MVLTDLLLVLLFRVCWEVQAGSNDFISYLYECETKLLILPTDSLNVAEFLNFELNRANDEIESDSPAEWILGRIKTEIPPCQRLDMMLTFDDNDSVTEKARVEKIGNILQSYYGSDVSIFGQLRSKPNDLFQLKSRHLEFCGCVYKSSNSTVMHIPKHKAFRDIYTKLNIQSHESNDEKTDANICQQYLVYMERNINSNLFYGRPVIVVPDIIHQSLSCQYDSKGTVYKGSWLNNNTDDYLEWLQCIRLEYDEEAETFSNQPGVKTRPILSHQNRFEYFRRKLMETGQQYESDRFALAPYDFRRAPDELDDYFVDLKKLFEESYYVNRERKVVLIAMGSGGLYANYFLNKMTDVWKQNYVHWFVSIATPWGGQVAAVHSDPRSHEYSTETTIVRSSSTDSDIYEFIVRISMPSMTLLLPNDLFWDTNQTIMKTDDGIITPTDYSLLFDFVRVPHIEKMHAKVQRSISELNGPGVKTYCVFGVGIRTPEMYNYSSSGDVTEYGDGDGVVNVQSATGCSKWIGTQKEEIVVEPLIGLKNFNMAQTMSESQLTNRLWDGIVRFVLRPI